MDLHNGLDIEVYDLRPTDLHYYYYLLLTRSRNSQNSSKWLTGCLRILPQYAAVLQATK